MLFAKFIKNLALGARRNNIVSGHFSLQSEKLLLMGWLLFYQHYGHGNAKTSYLVPMIGLHWKMISMGTQGKIKVEDQIKALYIYVDKLDVKVGKRCL